MPTAHNEQNACYQQCANKSDSTVHRYAPFGDIHDWNGSVVRGRALEQAKSRDGKGRTSVTAGIARGIVVPNTGTNKIYCLGEAAGFTSVVAGRGTG